ncbi:hypothetical protein MP228_009411 [Amoeboaphelidium protococcarum]|nr:hypothetical protein MP228_009411 [Amoeboaphelidium protococcarum]
MSREQYQNSQYSGQHRQFQNTREYQQQNTGDYHHRPQQQQQYARHEASGYGRSDGMYNNDRYSRHHPYQRSHIGVHHYPGYEQARYGGHYDDPRRYDETQQQHPYPSGGGPMASQRNSSGGGGGGVSRTHSGSRQGRPQMEESYTSDPSVIPLSEWPRPLKFWDQKPAGYEHLTAGQAKTTGLFPKGGLGIPFSAIPNDAQQFAGVDLTVDNDPELSKKRLVYIGGLLSDIDIATFTKFLKGDLLKRCGLNDTAVEQIDFNLDQNYVYVLFKKEQDAEQFNAEMFQQQQIKKMVQFNGQKLDIRRDNIATSATYSNKVKAESKYKIKISNIPTFLQQEHVRQFVESFGELKHLDLIHGGGYAFCEYLDSTVTDYACKGLTGIKLCGLYVVAERVNKKQTTLLQKNKESLIEQLQQIKHYPSTPVICLYNVLTNDELKDERVYNRTLLEINAELAKCAKIVSMHAPKMDPQDNYVPGLGRVFIEFKDIKSAERALGSIAGRKYNGRIVYGSYLSKLRYETRDF